MRNNILRTLTELAEARGREALALRKQEIKRWRLICGELFCFSKDESVDRARATAGRLSRATWHRILIQAVENADALMLDSLAEQLSRVETANLILRSKGYGGHGQSIDLAVRDVPPLRGE